MKSRSLCKCFKTMENRKDPGIKAPGGQKHLGMSSKTMDTGSKFGQQMPQRTFLTKQYLGKPISLIISRKRGEQERVHMMLLSFFSVWHIYFSLPLLLISVVDPEWFFSDPDRTFQIVSDPEPDPVSDRTWTFANIFNINLPFYYRLVSMLGCIHMKTRYSF